MPSNPAIDPTRCPLCNGANACAMEMERATGVTQGPCWCMTAPFGTALLQRVPSSSRGLACICARCASIAARSDPAAAR